jgi:hypothetical protein
LLTLQPSTPQPFRADQARDELLHLWDGMDLKGWRLVLANARAVADMAGHSRHKDPGRRANAATRGP